MRFRRNRRTADLRKFQAIYNKIIQKQFQMRMIKKHPKKDIYIYIYIYPEERQKIVDNLIFNIIV